MMVIAYQRQPIPSARNPPRGAPVADPVAKMMLQKPSFAVSGRTMAWISVINLAKSPENEGAQCQRREMVTTLIAGYSAFNIINDSRTRLTPSYHLHPVTRLCSNQLVHVPCQPAEQAPKCKDGKGKDHA